MQQYPAYFARMDTDVLKLFVDVARHASFAAAAREHGLDPSSVSRSIAALEEDLGVRLLQRSTRRMALTEVGEAYLNRIEAVLQELDAASEEAQALTSDPRGVLRLTASVAFGNRRLVPLLPNFQAEFPGLTLELVLSDATLDLVSERIDLAIRLAPSIAADVVAVKLFDTRYKVCAAPSFLKTAPRLDKPSDLASVESLLFTFPDYRTRWLFRDRRGAITEVPVRGGIVTSNALALRECALIGLGPALLADWLVDEDIAAGRLVQLFRDYEAAATSFETAAFMLYPSRAFLPNKVRAAMDFLRRHLGRGKRRWR
jgi:DNA-binding transcriptional LysR family regulator